MLAIRPNTKDGYVYIMNGEAIEEDEDERSAGKFSNNYIWEEESATPFAAMYFFAEI